MSDHPVLSPPAAQALVGLCRVLLAAARSWALYPPEHPAVRAAVLRLQAAGAEAVEERVAAGISATPSTLIVRGAPAPDELPISEVAALLHDRGILQIGFDAVVPAEALTRLLAFLALPPDDVREQGGVNEVWNRQGHPSIFLEAIDYDQALADREVSDTAKRRDDVWETIVAALSSGRRTLDEREQQRLLELAGDPAELAELARTVMADKCAADGSPMVTTQASTVLSSYRHLLSMAAVLAPERAPAILRNVGAALLELHPHISLHVLSLDGADARGGDVPRLAATLDEEGVARLLATAITLEGGPSPHLAQVFGLMVRDSGARGRVVDRARALTESRHAGALPFEALWRSIEELLLSYDDQRYVSDEYRAVLEGSGPAGGDRPAANVAEMGEWLEGLGEESVRHLSIALLADLLQLEPQADRARTVLDHLAALVDDLLIAGAYADTLEVLEAIRLASGREELAAAASEALTRAGSGPGMREAADTLGDLTEEEWEPLKRCCAVVGPGCFEALRRLLLEDRDTTASGRAGDVFVAAGEPAVGDLCALLSGATASVRRRVATLLGRIGSPRAVPSLQALLRTAEPRVLQAAVRALAGIDDPSAARAIHLALRATEGASRRAIVEALVAAGDRRVVPMLVRVLDNSRPLGQDHQVALDALEALGRVGDSRAVPAITAVMRVGAWLRRRRLRALKRAAVRALVAIGDRGAGQALDEAASGRDRLLRRIVRDIRTQEVAA